jgi:hypothetical protein
MIINDNCVTPKYCRRVKMSENNVEEKEILEEQVINEEAVEKRISETEEIQGGVVETKGSFIKNFSAVILDEAIIGIISIIILYIFEALLKLGGYSISQKSTMLFLIFVVVSILYTSIMETAKAGKTVGKKLLNI